MIDQLRMFLAFFTPRAWPHRHVWDDIHCTPVCCVVCGRPGWPRR